MKLNPYIYFAKKIIPESDFNDNLQIINPISNDLSMMRNIYPNLLDAVPKIMQKD